MTQPGIVMLSQRAIARLIIGQSVLTGLQVVAAASVLGDIVGSKLAALFIVVIAGAQQTVNSLLSKSAAATATHVEAALSRVDSTIDHAETATAQAQSAAAMFRQPRKRA